MSYLVDMYIDEHCKELAVLAYAGLMDTGERGAVLMGFNNIERPTISYVSATEIAEIYGKRYARSEAHRIVEAYAPADEFVVICFRKGDTDLTVKRVALKNSSPLAEYSRALTIAMATSWFGGREVRIAE